MKSSTISVELNNNNDKNRRSLVHRLRTWYHLSPMGVNAMVGLHVCAWEHHWRLFQFPVYYFACLWHFCLQLHLIQTGEDSTFVRYLKGAIVIIRINKCVSSASSYYKNRSPMHSTPAYCPEGQLVPCQVCRGQEASLLSLPVHENPMMTYWAAATPSCIGYLATEQVRHNSRDLA